jgi:hypothetical protein
MKHKTDSFCRIEQIFLKHYSTFFADLLDLGTPVSIGFPAVVVVTGSLSILGVDFVVVIGATGSAT